MDMATIPGDNRLRLGNTLHLVVTKRWFLRGLERGSSSYEKIGDRPQLIGVIPLKKTWSVPYYSDPT